MQLVVGGSRSEVKSVSISMEFRGIRSTNTIYIFISRHIDDREGSTPGLTACGTWMEIIN